MKETANSLSMFVHEIIPHLRELNEQEVSIKPLPIKWSKKEILGHLIDSATNNQKKFVMCSEQDKVDIVPYQQDEWVKIQAYQSADWSLLVELWYNLNIHLAHMITHADPKRMAHTLSISGSGSYSLEFVMKDYEQHLRHHLKVILPDLNIESNFNMVY